jgi:hypothetical protein
MKMYEGVELQLHALTLALDGAEWSTSHTKHFHPGKVALLSTYIKAGWALEPAWTLRITEESLIPAGNWTPVPQPVWFINSSFKNYISNPGKPQNEYYFKWGL